MGANSLAIVKAIGYSEPTLENTFQLQPAPFSGELLRLRAWQAANPPPTPTAVPTPQPVTYTPPVVQSVSTAFPAVTAYSGSVANWLLSLRTCESGGNYQENTGNGYYGAYQFSQSTWDHWNTGYAFAYEAPAAVQDATIIENTLATAGLSTQNPGCFIKMGLSNYPPTS